MEKQIEKGDVVVVIGRQKPKPATYVEPRDTGGKHVVRIGDEERLVERVIALTEQP